MRVVRDPAELEDAIEAARREAKAAFGDDRVYCERFVERPRHVEIQLLADAHGTVLSLGERECSIQRRHQKVLEESPSPALDPELRTRMSDAAVAFGRALGYRSAGTVEFMLDGRDFYLLELNGRIQVEHPVTELVTGVDIVQEQLRIAAGETLQQTVTRSEGHAVEVRLYAEDPRTFLPQAGRIERLRLPTGIRVDAGVDEGDEVGVAYDPMIAKLIAHGPNRDEALLPASRRARRDRRRGPDDEPPVPALARRAPGRPGGTHDDRVPLRVRAALRPADTPAERAVGRRVAHEPPAACSAHAARRRRALARRGRPVGRRTERVDRPDAGHRDQGARGAGRQGRAAPDAPRPGSDEDGDPGRVTVRRRPSRPCTSPRETGSPAARSWSSSTSSAIPRTRSSAQNSF